MAEPRSKLALALRDLHGLLERYAPLWYSSEYREMAEQSLCQSEKGQAKALSVLHELLEEYAPAWYAEKDHHSVELALKCFRKRKSSRKNSETQA